MIVLFVLGISILLQLAAAILALRLIRVTERRAAWILIATAIVLMVVRRGFTLLDLIYKGLPYSTNLLTETVAFATSLLLVIGIARIAPLFISIRRSEEALREYTLELEMRNEELDAFAHTVAHGLQNPLALIIGHADMLKKDCAAMPQELGERLGTIAQTGRRMSNIIDELLLLAEVRKLEKVEMGPLDMPNILARAQERLAHIIEEYQAEIILPAAWPTALGYAPWVEEVWVNYLSNAIKYGDRPPRVELGAMAQPDGMARFWVRDNGSGLVPGEQARLFTPFTRLDHTGAKGHGVGLSIVRRIVERLGGQVEVESKVGQGSVFAFTLPGVRERGEETRQ